MSGAAARTGEFNNKETIKIYVKENGGGLI